jgi:predicted dehydrogenase
MIRAASIGLGWWAGELAQAIQAKSDRIRIDSCFSRSEAKRDGFAAKFGTRTHGSFEALLGDDSIDAILVTTPHSLHAEHAIAAARAGKHVFVEKPFTLTAASGRAAAEACSKAGVTLAVGQNRRFSATAQELRRMADGNELGTILHIEGNFSSPSAMKWPSDLWRASRVESPAGGLAGLGVHIIDLMTWLGGRVERTFGIAKRRVLPIDIDDTTSALFELESGATGYLGTMCAAPHTVTFNVFATKASVFANVDRNEFRVERQGSEPVVKKLEPVPTLKVELEEFASACEGRGRFRVTPEEAIHTVAVMEAIARSAKEDGKPVEMTDWKRKEVAR